MKRAAVLLCIGLLGCSSPEEQLGANTSWYKSCETEADCEDQLSCFCGVCTSECASDEDCEAGVCGTSLEAAGLCPSAESRICLEETFRACSEDIEEQFDLGVGATADCVPGALLCESFDEPLAADVRVIEDESTQLVSQQCFSQDGGGSLTRLGAPANFGHATFPLGEELTTGQLHARFYFYVPTTSEIPNTAQVLRVHSGPEPDGQVLTLRIRNDRAFSLNYVVDGPSDRSDTDLFETDQWHCVELAVTLADAGSATVSLDGDLVLENTDVDTVDVEAPYDAVRALGATANDGSFFDIAFDELIVATEPIGCN